MNSKINQRVEEYVFETIGHRVSNNDDSAGNAASDFKAGWTECLKELMENGDEFDENTAKDAAWAELTRNELPAQRPTDDEPDIVVKWDEQQDIQREYFEVGALWQHEQSQVKIQALREENDQLRDSLLNKIDSDLYKLCKELEKENQDLRDEHWLKLKDKDAEIADLKQPSV